MHPKYIPIYIQQDATLHSLFISGNCSSRFGRYLHPSSGAQTNVSTTSGICHAVTAICRYRGRDGTGLSVLWEAYATHSTLKPVPTLPRKRFEFAVDAGRALSENIALKILILKPLKHHHHHYHHHHIWNIKLSANKS